MKTLETASIVAMRQYVNVADANGVDTHTLLTLRRRQPNPMLRKTLEAHALSQLTSLESDTDLTSRVKHAIQHQPMYDITRQDMVAEHLGMTSRTLQRMLGQEGAAYQLSLDEVRQRMAEDYPAEQRAGNSGDYLTAEVQ